ncbi:MAG: hypothetical protein K2Y18_07950 [Alphaproteobacteria bacterium]|jgi:hypothetical protein|nr:hypothetical protein [Alphaproteobacteria bacterium]
MILRNLILSVLQVCFLSLTTLAAEENGTQTVEFHEYSKEYFMYANTPQQLLGQVLIPKKPRILEIGAARGFFIEETLLTASENEKKVEYVAVEFKESCRATLRKIFESFSNHPFNHKCVLGLNPNVVDYIRRNPANKKEYFSSIISFYSLHCLCPSDLMEVLLACQAFLKPEGDLCLTLQCPEALETDSLTETLVSEFKRGDLFPGFNYDETRTLGQMKTFLRETLDYPLSHALASKKDYPDALSFAHDFAPISPTVHECQWTQAILEACGFEVKVCKEVTDTYPSRPLEIDEVSNDGIETKYLYVEARKSNKGPKEEVLKGYRESARKKEENLFALYKALVSPLE